MQNNPLFPSNEPANTPVQAGEDPAVEMIRRKIHNLYSGEPDAEIEAAQAQAETKPTSPHQAYMRSLTESGKSALEIQQAWHQYYADLPDTEKYQVWQEFYTQNGQQTASNAPAAASKGSTQQVVQPLSRNVSSSQNPIIAAAAAYQDAQPAVATVIDTNTQQVTDASGGNGLLQMPAPVPGPAEASASMPLPAELRGRSKQRASAVLRQAAGRLRSTAGADGTAAGIKNRILRTVRAENRQQNGGRAKLSTKHHLQSLGFGLAAGAVVVTIFLFSFFNELVIAPLIQPSRQHNDTPVIVDLASASVSKDPKVIIPKINVEIPVDYTQTTTNDKEIELALDKGVVHYPTTVRPGQTGNAAFFGHSSNNIFNPGKYKFAFVLLHELVEGDTFYLTSDGKTYAYRVFSKRIVQPTEVSVLNPIEGHPATATLITCDPPGTSINRLVVVGDQISPDINGNQPGNQTPVQTAAADSGKQDQLPANGPSLWSRIWGTIF